MTARRARRPSRDTGFEPRQYSTDSEGAALILAGAVKSATGEKADVQDDGEEGENATQEDVKLPAGWTYCVESGNHAYEDQNEDGIYVPKSSPHIKIHTNGADGSFEYRKPTTVNIPRKKRGETPRAFTD